MRKLISYFVIGMGIGQIFYLTLLSFMGVSTQTFNNMLSVSILSGFMGLASLVYSWEKLAPLYQRSLHILLIFGLVTAMMLFNGWFLQVNFLSFATEFFAIYAVITLGIIWYERSYVQKINKKIQQSRSNS